MNALIVLPVVHEETTDRCLNSIDKSFLGNILIVDNSVNKFATKYNVGHMVIPSQNLGVARSWNKGVELALNKGYEYLIIMSASLKFDDGMRGLVSELGRLKPDNGLMTQEGWHCLAIHREVFRLIGDFDTNFYPGYYEDSDFIRRMELANIHDPMGDSEGGKVFAGYHINAKSQETAHGIKRANIKVNMGACRKYFVEKWGYEPYYSSREGRNRLYKHPFNNPEYDLRYYLRHSIEELKVLYNLT